MSLIPKHSNTTLVSINLKCAFKTNFILIHSNTTLVSINLSGRLVSKIYGKIQIQLLFLLIYYQWLTLANDNLDSNTTLVSINRGADYVVTDNIGFKYNSCFY